MKAPSGGTATTRGVPFVGAHFLPFALFRFSWGFFWLCLALPLRSACWTVLIMSASPKRGHGLSESLG